MRVGEFEQLFASSLRSSERVSPTRMRLVLDPSVKARASELCERETQCCSFFTFTFGADERGLLLDVEVPPEQVAVLDALVG